MIDTDKYKIRDDVIWIWNDYPDEEGWVLWEYKECPAEKGGYPVGSDPDKRYEPWNQVLPSLIFECKIDERMEAIMDLPLIFNDYKDKCKEVKRLLQLIVDAAWQIHWVETTTATHMESNEWDESIHAPAQQWRKQVQEILDASEEGCPWKESDE